jgi:hypothetical protein
VVGTQDHPERKLPRKLKYIRSIVSLKNELPFCEVCDMLAYLATTIFTKETES